MSPFGYTARRKDSYIKLLDYNARFYSPYLNRWIQPDTIIPDQDDPQSWDRYAYVRNNPVNLVDPSGHRACTDEQAATGDETCDQNIDFDLPNYDPQSGPTNLPIDDWKERDRVERAEMVWMWLRAYQGSHWWSGGIDQRQIVAWILFKEGATLNYEDQVRMAQGIRAFIHDNDFFTMLAGMTSFINSDWESLVNPGTDMTDYLSIVDTAFNSPYNSGFAGYKFWFEQAEMDAANVDLSTLGNLGGYYSTFDVSGNPFYFTGLNVLAWCATTGSSYYCSP